MTDSISNKQSLVPPIEILNAIFGNNHINSEMKVKIKSVNETPQTKVTRGVMIAS